MRSTHRPPARRADSHETSAEDGFRPDIELIEEDADGDGYFDHYRSFGHPSEPLLARAIQEITGAQPRDTRSLMRTPANGKAYALPAVLTP